MSWQRPSPAEVWTAIDLYLSQAYSGGPPSAVRARLDTLRAAAPEDFYGCAVFECDSKTNPTRFALRLGNQTYPHMKLVIERSPSGTSHLFRADTHDRHACPDPQSREYGVFCELMSRNQDCSQRIENAWAEKDLPTFKTYLKKDLEKRARGN